MKKLFAVLSRAEFQAVALLLVVFVAGGFVGVAVDRARGRRPPPRADGPPRGGGPGGMQGGPPQGQRLPPYIEELDLSSEQHDQVRTILQAQRPKVDSALVTVLPALQRISDSTFASIRAVLTPEQQKLFDAARPQRDLAPGIPRGGGGPRPPRDDRMGPPRDDGRGPPRDGFGPPPGGGRHGGGPPNGGRPQS
jgi:Spy/CpxP family protein refolding chaperone